MAFRVFPFQESVKEMRIAVTGASGHIGANVCRALLHGKHEVRALFYQDDRAFRGLDVVVVKGDILNMKSLNTLIKDVDTVFHLAATISISGSKNPQMRMINIEGTRNVVNVSLKSRIKRFIHFSSIHALKQGPLEEELDETRPLVGDEGFLYDQTKAESERVVLDAVARGLDAVILNPTAVIGPNDFKPSLLGQAIIRLYSGKLPALVPGGYDWVDVRDVADAAIAAIEKGRKGHRYLLAGGWNTLRELSRIVENVTGRKTTTYTCPLWLTKLGLPLFRLYGAITRSHPLYTRESLHILTKGNRRISSRKAQKELGYRSRDVEETMRDTLNWFKENRYIT